MPRTVKFDFYPFEELGIEDTRATRANLSEAADYINQQILEHCERATSPVEGYGKFQKLSGKYRKRKVDAGGSSDPDLRLSGDMLGAVQAKVSSDKITIQVKGKQGDKADGHCNHSGDSSLPLRRFIPGDGETFKKSILSGVKKILKS